MNGMNQPPLLTNEQIVKLLLVLREATVPGARCASLLGYYATSDGMETYQLAPAHVEGVFREVWQRVNKVTEGTAERVLRAYEDYDRLLDKIHWLEAELFALRNPTPPVSVVHGVGSIIKDAYQGRVRTGEVVGDLDTHWRVNWGENHSKIRKDRVGQRPKRTGPWWPDEDNT